jgi:hypothetical protein
MLNPPQSLGLAIIFAAVEILVLCTMFYFVVRDAICAGMLKYDQARKNLIEKKRDHA